MMTEKEARQKVEAYREIDEDTGEEYGYIVQRYCGRVGDGYAFECKATDVPYAEDDILPLLAVYPDGRILNLPQ